MSVDGVEPAVSPPMSACPICASVQTRFVYRLQGAPVTCTSVFETVAEAVAVPTGSIELVACSRCGFLFNAAFDEASAETGARYESSQAASVHFNQFATGLALEWIDRYDLKGRDIVEVGCGDGDFMLRMLAAGVRTATGFDPLSSVSRTCVELRGRAKFVASRFEPHATSVDGDALVCRHTLEHVGRVAPFLESVRSWCARDPRRVALFEVPESERILAEGAFWDVYYEHCNYFTASSLRVALERAGLQLLRLETRFDGQYLIAEVRAAETTASVPSEPALRHALAAAHGFGERAREMIESCRSNVARMRVGGDEPVLWQGAAKTVGLLAALGSAHGFSFAADLSKPRQGRYLPGSGLAVRAPEALRVAQPRNVVLMNPAYLAEVRAELHRLAPAARLYTVNQLFRGQTD